MSITKPSMERRSFGRKASNDHARVQIPGRPPIRCVIHNMSPAGALLDLGSDVWLPYNFNLTWEAGGRTEECEVRHRNGQYVGVFFQRRDAVAPEAKSSPVVHDVKSWMSSGTGNRHS